MSSHQSACIYGRDEMCGLEILAGSLSIPGRSRRNGPPAISPGGRSITGNGENPSCIAVRGFPGASDKRVVLFRISVNLDTLPFD